MKRLAVLIFALAILLCGCARREETFSVGDWEYRVLPDGTAEIAVYRGNTGDPSVPSGIGARRVSSVGERAFSGVFPISSVTLPEGVTSIGDNAFYNCGQWLTLTVEKDSYAENYCRENGLKFKYSDTEN